MQILQNRAELDNYIKNCKDENLTIGFVPTMGALHRGHLSLLEHARPENDALIISIFVNPTQFNNAEDLEKYPRDNDADITVLKQHALADALYLPRVEDLYPEGLKSETYNFDGLEKEMEGASRPGHFDGVGTVVAELFRQVRPHNAYFGEKDFQQLAIIQKMVEKNNIDVKIHPVPIYREESGLAMSSRNQRLSAEGQQKAALIHETLVKVNDWFRVITIPEIKKRVEEIFAKHPDFTLEYFTIADEQTLQETDFFYTGKKFRAFIAVWLENVRLIDNMELK